MTQVIVFSIKSLLQLCFLCLALSTIGTIIFANTAYAAITDNADTERADVAGRIIMTKGDVKAIGVDGISRQLKRRDSIYSHEVIKTGIQSKVQIRFIDNALLALKSESELNIKAYVYSETNDENNQVLLELVAGGFRTLTGKIGKGNKEAYKVDTPVASIGIRGTLYDIQIDLDKILAGVWKGGISLSTPQGKFNLGMNANFDFGEISANGAFTGLLNPPKAFTPPTPKQKKADKEKTDPAENVLEAKKNKFKADNKEQAKRPLKTRIIRSKVERDASNIPSPFEKKGPPTRDKVENSERFNASNNNPTQEIVSPSIPPGAENSPDIRLNDAEIAQLSSDPKLAVLLSADGQRYAIALNKDGNGEDFFLASIPAADGTLDYETLRRGEAPEADFSNATPWSDSVGWGIWQGSKTTPIERYTQFNNNTDYVPLEQKLFYMTVSPAGRADLNSGLVSGRFSTSITNLPAGTRDYIASASNGGLVTNVDAGFDVTAGTDSFSINNISMVVEVDTNPQNEQVNIDQTWALFSASGDVKGSGININNLSGVMTDNVLGTNADASGDLSGFLLAPDNSGNVDTFAGGFSLSTDEGDNSVSGAVILKSGQ